MTLPTLTLLNAAKGWTNGDIVSGGYLMMTPGFQKVYFADGRKRADGCFHKLDFQNDVLTGSPSAAFSRGETLTQAVSGAEGIFDESIGTLNMVYRTETTPFDTTNLITGAVSGSTLTASAITYPPYWTAWTTRTLTEPAAGTGTISSSTNYLPVGGSNIGCLFSGRLMINSIQNPNHWTASRHRDPQDFQVSQSDLGTPVSSQTSKLGIVGDAICAMVPFLDHYMYFGCLDEIWIMRGDPANCQITNSSRKVGMYGPDSYAFDEKGNLFFLSMDGFYMFQAGSGFSGEPPQNLTYTRLPNLVSALGLNRRTDRVVMEYDKDRYGINVVITMMDGTYGSAWFWDLRLNALMPDSFADAHHYAASLYYYNSRKSDTRGLLMGGQDGYIRKYDDTEKNDEGSNAIDAYCTLGPFQAFPKMRRQGSLSEMSLRLGEDTDSVDVQVYAADAAETVVNAVKTADTPQAQETFTGGGRRPVYRPRTTGAVFAIQLRNNNASERFALERITAKFTDAGEVKGV
ncbi:MAG: hypothetical protein IMZ61_13855 [Planctomycetes bacterium]|nr:hypothetical protein [Chloroflexota bacterium]MBE3144982.1 hypothetical protein [Planctomycetota bacterium]